ncbi:MAG: SET domain-containing protein [Alphaproteobacteria bacterium]|nr:MAG: SET domain-containing protein [Alphaproteobacteria bacterium]
MGAAQAGIASPAAAVTEAARLYEVRETVRGRGVFACRAIPAGTPLFGEDDWTDEAERKSFSPVTAPQLEQLTPAIRATFLRFAYNTAPEQIMGTFHPEHVRHPANFLNHSCEPNAGYDGADAIVALRRISAGEEICMDYGTFSFSFDHEFKCACGAWGCRGQVRRDDWRALVRAGLRLPRFMRALADRALWG